MSYPWSKYKFNDHGVCKNPDIIFRWTCPSNKHQYCHISICCDEHGWSYGYWHFNGSSGCSDGINRVHGINGRGFKKQFLTREEAEQAGIQHIKEYIKDYDSESGRHHRNHPYWLTKKEWNDFKEAFNAFIRNRKQLVLFA